MSYRRYTKYCNKWCIEWQLKEYINPHTTNNTDFTLYTVKNVCG